MKLFALVLKTKKVEIMLFVCRSHVSKTVVNSVAGKKILCFLCVVNVLGTKNLSGKKILFRNMGIEPIKYI